MNELERKVKTIGSSKEMLFSNKYSRIIFLLAFWLKMTFSSVQSLSHVWLFATPWPAICQASLPFTNSQSLLKLMSIESVMPSNHLILCCPLLLLPSIFPSIRVFSSESALRIRWPKYWVSASASALPMNIQGWFPLGLTGWISLLSKGLSRVFSSTRVQKHQMPEYYYETALLLLYLTHPIGLSLADAFLLWWPPWFPLQRIFLWLEQPTGLWHGTQTLNQDMVPIFSLHENTWLPAI